MMGKLKVLPVQIANMIAAGEVVQRPASVVKELLENAVDAGASRIDVVISDAGRTLIQVIDNGCGMSPSDAVLCFERHATSKIATPDDLESITTYGFRGEALASIAAVSEVCLRTRRAIDETAVEVRVTDGSTVKSASVSAPTGSNFAIRNLFYNTPARRKFLKTDNVELKHIVEEFTRVAITRPDIHFTMTSNGRDMYVLKPAKSLKFRVLDLLGGNVAGEMVDISANTSVADISGFIGRPDSAKKTLGNQYFFVNGRFFKSAYLHKAVMKAYEEMIPDGVTPSYFIFMKMDPHSVDVNIHPSKTEVKFEEDTVIFQVLYACVRETLGKNSFGGSIDFDTEGAVEMPVIGRDFDQYRQVSAPVLDVDPEFNPFSSHTDRNQNYGKLFEDRTLPSTRVLNIQGKYILAPAVSGILVVNVRRARERIMYDRFLSALGKGAHVTQTALFPIQIQVGVQGRLLFDENAELLSSLGFDISPFGVDTIAVNGVPEGYSCEAGKVESLIADVSVILSEGCASLPELMQQTMAQRFASLGAAHSESISSPVEAQSLIDTLFASENAELTPGGQRIMYILTVEELEKKF
ncbi:MAG: DNA mismatch repair endonuclease MutL [Bacteroidales bacterium]|nr:DNA mismatch repair endonuclease MutL [Bacteroidales bacterium]